MLSSSLSSSLQSNYQTNEGDGREGSLSTSIYFGNNSPNDLSPITGLLEGENEPVKKGEEGGGGEGIGKGEGKEDRERMGGGRGIERESEGVREEEAGEREEREVMAGNYDIEFIGNEAPLMEERDIRSIDSVPTLRQQTNEKERGNAGILMERDEEKKENREEKREEKGEEKGDEKREEREERKKGGIYYVIDVARLFPPVAPTQNGAKNSFLFHFLRPEFVRNFPSPLSSDAFSKSLSLSLSLLLPFFISLSFSSPPLISLYSLLRSFGICISPHNYCTRALTHTLTRTTAYWHTHTHAFTHCHIRTCTHSHTGGGWMSSLLYTTVK